MKKNSYNEIGLIVNGENIIISILIAVLVFTLSLISYQIELFYKYENYLIVSIILSVLLLIFKVGIEGIINNSFHK